MAYLRYSSSCGWYVFEQLDKSLAVWHVSAGEQNASFTLDEILAMLSEKDFASIPGYRLDHSDQLANAFREWINELNNEN